MPCAHALCAAPGGGVGGRANLGMTPGWFSWSDRVSWASGWEATFLGASDLSLWLKSKGWGRGSWARGERK